VVSDMTFETNDTEEERRRSPLFFLIAFIAALAVTASLLLGYMYLRRRHAEQTLTAQQTNQTANSKPIVPAKVQVYEDEAMIKGGKALIGGTLHNISQETFSDLSVELELTRRKDNSKEKRTLKIEPKDLAPDQQGRYSLSVLSRDYKSARLTAIRSGASASEIAFHTAAGARRPPEKIQPKTVIVNRPPPRKPGEEFLNTPNNPVTVK
jgi:Tfp pilus assembly protein PilN